MDNTSTIYLLYDMDGNLRCAYEDLTDLAADDELVDFQREYNFRLILVEDHATRQVKLYWAPNDRPVQPGGRMVYKRHRVEVTQLYKASPNRSTGLNKEYDHELHSPN